jgi:hypothetical protein
MYSECICRLKGLRIPAENARIPTSNAVLWIESFRLESSQKSSINFNTLIDLNARITDSLGSWRLRNFVHCDHICIEGSNVLDSSLLFVWRANLQKKLYWLLLNTRTYVYCLQQTLFCVHMGTHDVIACPSVSWRIDQRCSIRHIPALRSVSLGLRIVLRTCFWKYWITVRINP